MKSRTISFTSILFIIVLCIAALFKTSFDQYKEQNILRSSSLQMTENNKQISRLDSISITLNEAENDYRMYTSLWDKTYFIKYNKSITHVSAMLDTFSKKSELRDASESISQDLAKKNKQLLLYARIKRLTDSLTFINLEMASSKKEQSEEIKPQAQRIIRKTVKIEEVKTAGPEKKTKLFQRLRSAILNKEEKKASTTTEKIETTYQKSAEKPSLYTKQQLKGLEDYYRKLFRKQQQNHINLTEKEQSILKLNQQILQNIKVIFYEFSRREHLTSEIRSTEIKNKNLHAIKVIDRSGKIYLIINMISLFVIAFLLIKLYYAYNRILKSKKAAEEQVITKSRFFTGISHEMRTPLNAILGVTEQLKSTPLNEEQQAMSRLMETSSSMLLSAVNEILDFSRLENGKLSLSKTPFYYKKISCEIVAATSVLATEKGLTLTLTQDKAPALLVIGDPYRLKQIIVNLIANAIKFTDQGEVNVYINVKQVDKDNIILLIQITDTGIGIAEKDLPFIFDEFSQVIHHKRVDWQKGSGLGLPITKKLIQLHQGKIEVISKVNKGTTFSIEIPYMIAPEDAVPRTTENNPLLHTDAFKNSRLLIVDDAEMNLLVIKMILNKFGINFETASNGEEALAIFENEMFDMVLTDIEMPQMDGIELTKKIRAHTNAKKALTPIIATTGQISPESHLGYITAGINDYLIKPFNEKELLEKILDYLPIPEK